MPTVYTADVGTEIILNCGVDITELITCSINIILPNKKTRVWSAELSGTTSIRHIVGVGELDLPGTWILQAYVEVPGWHGRGAPVELIVQK